MDRRGPQQLRLFVTIRSKFDHPNGISIIGAVIHFYSRRDHHGLRPCGLQDDDHSVSTGFFFSSIPFTLQKNANKWMEPGTRSVQRRTTISGRQGSTENTTIWIDLSEPERRESCIDWVKDSVTASTNYKQTESVIAQWKLIKNWKSRRSRFQS
jgi:hypothetical protein